VNLFRRLGRDGSMSMPPSELAIRHTRCAGAIHDHGDVELLLDVGALLDQQPPDFLAGPDPSGAR
jgi:hypothetical protein